MFPQISLFLPLLLSIFGSSSSSNNSDIILDAATNQLLNYIGSDKKSVPLTTGWGAPVADRGNVLTAGPKGPILLEDVPFLEEYQRFDRERIPRRIMHSRGAGAFGYFTVTDDVTPYCKASLFSSIGKKTPIVVRFSLENSFLHADSERAVRGFAIKFFTAEGVLDLVGHHLPVFPIRDPFLFISQVHSQERNPVTFLRDPDTFWDFRTLRIETTLLTMLLFSDKGIPFGYRFLSGYPINTFILSNATGGVVFCKFKYVPDQGRKYLNEDIALTLAATSRDYATKDLYNAIAQGNFPSWTFYIQVMTPLQAQQLTFNALDPTKIWPVEQFPLKKVGKFILNKNQDNYFTDIEQLAFSPGRLVPGIEPSTDKILQARLFAYSDSQLHRLGPNYLQLPVNSPFRNPLFNTQRDGKACFTDNQGGTPNYYPSSFVKQLNSARGRIVPFSTNGEVNRYNSSNDDDFSQPRMLWRQYLDPEEQLRLVKNLAKSLKEASTFIQERAVMNFFQVDDKFGAQVKQALKV